MLAVAQMGGYVILAGLIQGLAEDDDSGSYPWCAGSIYTGNLENRLTF